MAQIVRYANPKGVTPMAGTHYTLDRDRVENKNPMDLIKEKACERCGTVKPNDFQFFGKKLWKTRHDLTTNDVCLACQRQKVSDSMKARWKARKGADKRYEDEQLRMARTVQEANDALKAKAEKISALEEAEKNPGVKRLDLADALSPDDVVKAVEAHSDDTTIVDQSPKEHEESPSERLMRELLGGS
jgi:uncharacterized protein YukE